MANKVTTLLEALAGCLCNELAAANRKTCFCGVIPGDMAVATYGTNCRDRNGMAWVRLASMFPTEGIAQQSITPGNCNAGIGFEIEVGILRSVGVKPDGKNPSDAELLAASQATVDDALLMRKAITCCPVLDPKDYILGDWVPAGPLGGLAGGVWRLTAAL